MRDDRVDAGLNATLDIYRVCYVQDFVLRFSCLDQLRQALKSLLSWMWRTRHLQPLLAFMPKASKMKLQRIIPSSGKTLPALVGGGSHERLQGLRSIIIMCLCI